MSFFNKVLSKIFGDKSDKDLKDILPLVEIINAELEKLKKLSNDQLRAETIRLQLLISEAVAEKTAKIDENIELIESGKIEFEDRDDIYNENDKIEESIKEIIDAKLDEILPVAFAIMKETATRFNNGSVEVTANDNDRELAAIHSNIVIDGDKAIYEKRWFAGGAEVEWNMIHYDVQLIGGIVLHQGKIAEMATGEGKTLVSTLPVFLNALPKRGVHVITVNDYLARRDAEWNAPLYYFHGLSVDCIDNHESNSDGRRTAYNADITYGTNNEFGFDYLRDNMAVKPTGLVQRKHNYAIVDEVDSVLVDDARTPLIISGPVPKSNDKQFFELKPQIEKLINAQRKLVSEALVDAKKKMKSEDPKVQEEGAFILLRSYKGLPKNSPLIKFLSQEGIKAKMVKMENNYMQEQGKHMHKVTDPLYFVIDEQNRSIELTDNGIEILSEGVEDKDFFVLPNVGDEIAVLEKNKDLSEDEKQEKKDALLQDFSVKSERVHTLNQLLKAYTLFEKDTEYVLMDGKVKIVDEQTGRIMEGRRYSDGLHQAIEAKENVKIEAATQTMATITLQNYFRMYHKLSGMTGTAETEAGELWDIYKLDVVVIPTNRPIQRLDHEDKVYKTQKEKYNAVIEEILELNAAGRPVLVGTTSVDISELLSRFLKMRGIKHNVLNAKLHQREADVVAEAGKPGAVTIATNMAGRGTDIKLSDEIKSLGGLAIIGTERHDSRRVDRQLRGRAGRQGDPGSSQFFVSLQDDLMRLFASDRLVNIMDKMGFEEGEVIQHSAITKSIERAQKKVEENNFGIRKNLLEYDDVMNSQRDVIYTKRRHALYGERIDTDIMHMIYDTVQAIVDKHHPFGADAYQDLVQELMTVLSITANVTEEQFTSMSREDITEALNSLALDSFKRKVDIITEQALPVVERVQEHQSHLYKNIVVPIHDGKRMFQIVANIEKACESKGREIVDSYQKQVILATIDEYWKEQLRELDDLRQSVRNATYEQKDPLLIYKLESFTLFETMLDRINRAVVSTLMKGQIYVREDEEIKQVNEERSKAPKYSESKQELASPGKEKEKKVEKAKPVRVENKVRPNDPCPCGSGKKFKKCHGVNPE